MITTDHKGRRVAVAVLGEFTLADFKEFEELAIHTAQFEGPVDLLFDLTQMAGFTVDMAWEEIRFSREHGRDFGRIAVVTESQWVAWSAWLEQIFVTADLRVFTDGKEARQWLEEGAGAE
ncbi:MAG: STAS/SEC14 domain-containing protein [Rhodocyclaceae bacterium]|nr:STAS/SEC14 domain-containing protein [Rhodocyclaceae bacterium]